MCSSDLPANYKLQSLYVIKDDDLMATVPDLRIPGIMVEQTIAATSGSRTGSNNPVDFTTLLGWYADFPNSAATGERQNIKSLVVSGLLIVPTIIPPTGSCDITGTGWKNVFDVKTGALITSTQTTAPIAGLFITIPASSIPAGGGNAEIIDPIGLGIEGVTEAGGLARGLNGACPNDNPNCNILHGLGINGGFVGNRAVWRELIQ